MRLCVGNKTPEAIEIGVHGPKGYDSLACMGKADALLFFYTYE